MQRCLQLADLAAAHGEVPVGALVVVGDKVVGEGYNRPISNIDPSAHAEILAIRAAADFVGNYRLPEATLYVSLEPCAMCAGALIHSRIKRLVYGALEPRAGAVCSKLGLLDEPWVNHRVEHEGGCLADLSSQRLTEFFRARR